MKKCVIISGGEYEPMGDINSSDFLIACDKGYDYACRSYIVPDLVVGDFDSYDGEINIEIPVLRYQSEKDDTDTMIAVRFAIEHGYEEIQLRCALGGRLDHTIANIQAGVFATTRGVDVSIIGADTEIYILNNASLTISKREDCSISLFSYTNICEGVTATGVKYPLTNAKLTNTFPLGVSNEWADNEAMVQCGSGVLLIILSKLA